MLKDTGVGVGEGPTSCAVPLWKTHAASMQNQGLESRFGRTWLSLPRSPVSMTEGYLGARTSPGTRVAPEASGVCSVPVGPSLSSWNYDR